MSAFMGKILRVDLTDRSIQEEPASRKRSPQVSRGQWFGNLVSLQRTARGSRPVGV